MSELVPIDLLIALLFISIITVLRFFLSRGISQLRKESLEILCAQEFRLRMQRERTLHCGCIAAQSVPSLPFHKVSSGQYETRRYVLSTLLIVLFFLWKKARSARSRDEFCTCSIYVIYVVSLYIYRLIIYCLILSHSVTLIKIIQ